ncbi:MAG: hypothetical protein K2P84_00070 [Undibacterium sp.]|nr:hypothetical protein [Undibacterium sp.]
MSDVALELKIQALVEGLASINQLANDLRGTGTAATAASTESVSAAERTEAAYATLGTRSFAEIRAEIARIQTAYETLANSGSLSAAEQGNAAHAAATQIAALNQQMQAVNSTTQAYSTLGIRSFSEIQNEITRVRAAYQQLASSGNLSSEAQSQAANATASRIAALTRELHGVPASAGAAAGGLEGMNTPMGFLKDNLGKLIGAFAALAIAYGLKESADYAARTEVLGTTLGVVAKNAGYSTAQMAGYEKEVKGLGITTQATREALTQMIQAGLEIGPTAAGEVAQVAKLARAAQDLAVVTGENSSKTLTRLISNIQQMDTEGLRYMGLTVNIQQAQDKYALSLGKTSEQLSQQQKIQAVANQALAQAATLTGAYEASMQNVGKQLQSIKRYQEELANDIGSKLLPAYYQLVKEATDFLKQADAIVVGLDKDGESARKLAEGTKVFFAGLKELGLSILSLVVEITPALIDLGSELMKLFGDLAVGTGAILNLGAGVDATGQKFTGLGSVLRVIIETFTLLVAGFRDGADFIGMVFSGLVGNFQVGVGIMEVAWGSLLNSIWKGWGDATKKAGEEMIQAGLSLRNFAEDTWNRFAEGKTHVQEFNAELGRSKELAASLAAASSYKDIEEQIRKLVEEKRQNEHLDESAKKSDAEFIKRAEEIKNRIKEMGGEIDATTGKTKLSTEQMVKLGETLTKVSRDSVEQFNQAVNDLGLHLVKFGNTEYLVPLNKEFEKASGEILKLAANATATGLQFREAFSKGLDSAKTLADIDKISQALVEVKKAGKDVGDAALEVNTKFEQLFTTALKAAKTKEDFALLKAELTQLGSKGEVSANLIKQAFSELEEKIKGTRAEMTRMAEQAKNDSAAIVNVAKAHLDMVKADIDVRRAGLDVQVKQNAYAREGTEVARLELQLAQTNLEIARAKATEAKLQFDQAVAARNMLINQQRQLNAEVDVELHKGDALYIQKAKQAELNTENAKRQLDVATTAANTQEKVVLALEEEGVKQEFLVQQAKVAEQETKKIKDNMQDTADATDKAATAMDNFANASGRAKRSSKNQTENFEAGGESLESLTKKFQDAGLDYYSARASADGLVNKQLYVDVQAEIDKVKASKEWEKNFGSGGMNNYGGGRGSGQTGTGWPERPAQYGLSADEFAKRTALSQLPNTQSSLPNINTTNNTPTKTIQVNFTDSSGRSVAATVDATNETALLEMLRRAKGVSV